MADGTAASGEWCPLSKREPSRPWEPHSGAGAGASGRSHREGCAASLSPGTGANRKQNQNSNCVDDAKALLGLSQPRLCVSVHTGGETLGPHNT